jgi:alpha-galactosidase
MLTNTFKTLSNLKSLFPSYSGECELAGFVWHQGWNDGCDVNMTAEHEHNLANLIRDIRVDLSVPNPPVVIGVSGMSGCPTDVGPPGRWEKIIQAQFAVANNATKHPEFAGTVAAVETRPFARMPRPHSPGNQGCHWMNNCE